MRNIDDTLRQASDEVHAAVATMGERAPKKPRRRFAPVIVLGAAALALVLVGLPLWAISGSTEAPGTAAPTLADEREIPSEVVASSVLDGTLESVGGEEGWLCPVSTGADDTAIVAEADMPPELGLELPGHEPTEVFNRDGGPACRQPHLLVLLGSDSGAGMTVWPRLNRFEDSCPADVCRPEEGSVEETTVNGQSATLHQSGTDRFEAWWTDESGTPLYAEASGLERDRILQLIAAVRVDPVTHRASAADDALENLSVVSDQESRGIWQSGYWRATDYDVDGRSLFVDVSFDAAFDAEATYATAVSSTVLSDVEGIPAVWSTDEGGSLTFTVGNGVSVLIGGAGDLATAVEIAEQLRGPAVGDAG